MVKDDDTISWKEWNKVRKERKADKERSKKEMRGRKMGGTEETGRKEDKKGKYCIHCKIFQRLAMENL